MYQEYFKLKEMPFEITPDPRFLHWTNQHTDAYQTCLLTIKERRGFTGVYGDIGMGKTSIARLLMERAKTAHYKAGYIINPSLYSETKFLKTIMDQFDVHTERSKADSLAAFQEYMAQQHQKGENLVLIIDEAQELKAEHFKVLLILSNYESNKHKFIQVVLIGQNELAKRLEKYPNIMSRMARYARLRALTFDDCKELIAFRWHAASAGKKSHPFTEKALETIYILSGGLPREIIKYCHESLVIAYRDKKEEVTEDEVMEAAKNVRLKDDEEEL